jgi:aryl-alcohol dehydrogenase-like predicted oxidoreductase
VNAAQYTRAHAADRSRRARHLDAGGNFIDTANVYI